MGRAQYKGRLLISLADTSAWAFGWEALVAIGTLLLAVGTAYLAWSTRAVARKTRDLAVQTAADVQAQWRPVLVPAVDEPPMIEREPNGPFVLRATVQNTGRGPALFVRILHDPSNNSPENWSLGALSPGEHVRLEFRNVAHLAMSQLLIDYRDLTRNDYSTAIVLDHPEIDKRGRYYDVRFGEGEHFTPHGDAVPQPGLRQVGST